MTRRVVPVVILALIMFLSLSITLLPVLATRGSYPGMNGNIVFQAPCVGCPFEGLYMMNPDGTDLKELNPPSWTYDPAGGIPPAYDPVWSPDGSRIAFSYEPFANDIWVMNADGSNWVKLTDFGIFGVRDTGDAAWSPDGSKIAFTTYGTTINAVAAVPGATPTALTTGQTDGSPHWSPDGTKILFHRYSGGYANPDIYLMNADGTDQKLIRSGLDPCWSPNGSKIAFSSGAGIWVMSAADGTLLAKLTSDGDDRQPNWSPDGSKIIFTKGGSHRDDPGSIWVMNADGSVPTELTPWAHQPGKYARAPDWQRLPAVVPVGGEVATANAFYILGPWLAVIGLVGCIGTVVVVAMKRHQ